MANVAGVYETGVQTGHNRRNLGCTVAVDIQTVTTWDDVDLENGSVMEVYANDHLTVVTVWKWFLDKWALLATL